MTWLAEHLTALAWIGGAWSLLLLHLAGSLWRWLHSNDEPELTEEQAWFCAEVDFWARRSEELHPNATQEQDAS